MTRPTKKAGLTNDSQVISTVRTLAMKCRGKREDAEYHIFIRDPKNGDYNWHANKRLAKRASGLCGG